MTRRRWIIGALSMAGTVAVACSPSATPAPAPAAKAPAAPAVPTSAPAAQPAAAPTQAPAAKPRAKSITMTVLGLPPSLFFGTGGWSNLSKTDALIGDWLVMPDPEGKLIPRLAREVPTITNGGATFEGDGANRRLKVTYRLRDNLTWADGAPLTADDVKFAFELQSNPEFPMIERSLVAKVGEVRVADKQTIEFQFKPGQFDPDYARVGEAAPRHLWGGIAPAQLPKSQFATNPVHAGPFKLKELKPNEYALFEANPKYWAGPPKTETLIIKNAADSNAMFAQARAGQQDITAFGYTGSDLVPELEKFAADGKHKVIERPSTSTLIIGLNVERPILADVRVRRALMLAMDRPGMMKAILHGRVQPLNSWMTPASAGFEAQPDLVGGPEAAKKLLAEAGWSPGADGILTKGGERFKITFWGRTEDRQREVFMQAVARDWKAVGVEAQIILQPTAQVFGKRGEGVISRRDFDSVVWQVSPMDAAGGFTLWHSSQIPSDANKMTGENYFGWKNPRADEAMAKARATTSEDERVAAYKQHQKAFWEDLPALPLYSHKLLHLVRTDVQNYRPTNSVRVADTWNAWEWEAASR
jgi:peptide/nickel transport system substrate-binding protein